MSLTSRHFYRRRRDPVTRGRYAPQDPGASDFTNL